MPLTPLDSSNRASQTPGPFGRAFTGLQRKAHVAAHAVFKGFVFVASAVARPFAGFRDARSIEEKRSDAFNRAINIALEKPDAAFGQEGLVRKAVGALDKQELKARFLRMRPTAEYNKEIQLDMAIAISKELLKEMNLFREGLHTQVVDFGADPPTNPGQLIAGLKQIIGQLPAPQQEQLKSFIGLVHRVTQHQGENQMHASNVAIALNDTLSPTTEEGFGAMIPTQQFTKLLIENYQEVFST